MFQLTSKRYIVQFISSKASIQPLQPFLQFSKSRPHTQYFQPKLTNSHFTHKLLPVRTPIRKFYHVNQIPSQERKKENEETKRTTEKWTMLWGWMAVAVYIGWNTVVIKREQKEEFEAELATKDVIIKELEGKLRRVKEREGQGEVRLSFEDDTLGMEKVPMICNF